MTFWASCIGCGLLVYLLWDPGIEDCIRVLVHDNYILMG